MNCLLKVQYSKIVLEKHERPILNQAAMFPSNCQENLKQNCNVIEKNMVIGHVSIIIDFIVSAV